MSHEQAITRHKTRGGTVLWKVGTSQRNLLLDDAEFLQLTKLMNENAEVLENAKGLRP